MTKPDKRVEVLALAKMLAHVATGHGPGSTKDRDLYWDVIKHEIGAVWFMNLAQALLSSGVMDEIECQYRLTPDGKHCGIPQCGPCRHNAAAKGWVG